MIDFYDAIAQAHDPDPMWVYAHRPPTPEEILIAREYASEEEQGQRHPDMSWDLAREILLMRELKVLALRTLCDLSFSQIGRAMGFSSQRAHKLHSDALRKLRAQE